MGNKKGFLLAEETVKIVIALIVIVFLIYLLTSIYFKSQGDKELGQARASLEYLVENINSGNDEAVIFNPPGYYFASWSSDNLMPRECSDSNWGNCICICKTGTLEFVGGLFVTPLEKKPEKCEENGICLESPGKTRVFDNSQNMGVILINNDNIPLKINIEHLNDEVLITKG